MEVKKPAFKKWSRRRWLCTGAAGVVGGCAVEGFLVGPRWVDVNRYEGLPCEPSAAGGLPFDSSDAGGLPSKSSAVGDFCLPKGVRLVQFSDLHYKGDVKGLQALRKRLEDLKPSAVVFTGDLVERKDKTHMEEVLHELTQFSVPLIGVHGNHDPADQVSNAEFREAYAQTGGKFLINDKVIHEGVVIHGSFGVYGLKREEKLPKVLLCHYPAVGHLKEKQPYQLILSGHSHGGQVRVPFVGPLILPPKTGGFDRGFFKTNLGPLYVNVGMGTFRLPVRFACRPEISVFEGMS